MVIKELRWKAFDLQGGKGNNDLCFYQLKWESIRNRAVSSPKGGGGIKSQRCLLLKLTKTTKVFFFMREMVGDNQRVP